MKNDCLASSAAWCTIEVKFEYKWYHDYDIQSLKSDILDTHERYSSTCRWSALLNAFDHDDNAYYH